MTQSLQPSSATQPDAGLATRAADAAAAVLPATTPLSAAGPQEGTEHVTAPFAGASIARVTGTDGREHRLAVLVGSDLVSALAESPLGGLDLAAATQPAIDAAAEVLGTRAVPAAQVDLGLVVNDMGGPFTAVPLVGAGIDAAVLLTDTLLEAADASAAPQTQTGQAAQAQPGGAAAGAPAAPGMPDLSGLPAAPSTPAAASGPAHPAPGSAPVAGQVGRGIEMLAGVEMEVTVELGRTRMPVRDLLALSPGTVLELDRAADGPADLLVNGRLIARGEVVVVDEDFGLRITQIVDDSGA